MAGLGPGMQRRHVTLVGRDAERAALQAALRDGCRVIYLHGAGGIGKSALLAAFVEDCAAARVSVVRLDARDVEPVRPGFLHALARALGKPRRDPLAVLAERRGRVALVIDSYERLGALDDWLREHVVPALPPRALLVVAGRQPPSAAWRAGADWNRGVRSVALSNLPREAALALLAARGVPGADHEPVFGFTHGHPLAMCLVADVLARRPDAKLSWEAVPDVVQALLGHFVGALGDDRQLAALDVCSLVRFTTEPLLAAVLGKGARPLLRWLAGLSFIEIGPHGLAPHDLVRDVLVADLKWRNPARLAELVSAASAHYALRLQAGIGPDSYRLANELMYLHSHHPVISAFTAWRGAEGLSVEAATSGDVPALVDMVAKHEGRLAADVAARWIERQPEGVVVVRDDQPVPAGFLLTVELQRASATDLAQDPVARRAWRHATTRRRIKRGHIVLLQRFMVARDPGPEQRPVRSLLGSQALRNYLTTPALDSAYTCLDKPDFWKPLLEAAFGAIALPPFELDNRRLGLFLQSFREQSPFAWLAWLARRGAAREGTAPVRKLSRGELRAALKRALHGLQQPHTLDGNPLGTPAKLPALLHEIAEAMRATTRGAPLYRALHHAYLQPAANQRQAARRAGAPYATFRRHLTRAIDQMTDILLHRQRDGV